MRGRLFDLPTVYPVEDDPVACNAAVDSPPASVHAAHPRPGVSWSALGSWGPLVIVRDVESGTDPSSSLAEPIVFEI
jgi:hypothetical protein